MSFDHWDDDPFERHLTKKRQSSPPLYRRRWVLMSVSSLILITIALIGYWQLTPDASSVPTSISSTPLVMVAPTSTTATTAMPSTAVALIRPTITSSTDPVVARTLLLQAVNELRQQQSVAPLVINPQLVQAAQTHSDDMAAMNTLSHTGSDDSDVSTRVTRTGYTWSAVGENVLYQFSTDPQQAYENWLDSPPHYANMVNSAFTDIGIAYTAADSGRVYYTMVLATSR